MATGDAVTGALTFTGIWTATAYGVSVDAVMVAMIPTLLGAFGRVGFEMARAADPNNKVKWSSVLYLFGGTLISTPTISVLGLILIQIGHAHSDPMSFFGLFFAGFVGPKSILWLTNTISALLNKATGMKIPQLGPQGNQEDQKP